MGLQADGPLVTGPARIHIPKHVSTAEEGILLHKLLQHSSSPKKKANIHQQGNVFCKSKLLQSTPPKTNKPIVFTV